MGHSHKHNDSDATQIFGVAALAAGVGALAALLFTNKNGAETREALRTKFQDIKSKPNSVKQDIDEAADSAADIANKIHDHAADATADAVDHIKFKANKIDKN